MKIGNLWKEHWDKYYRQSVLFLMGFSFSVLMIWVLNIIRSSEFVQKGYFFYDGQILLALTLLLSLPISAIIYKFFKPSTIPRIIIILLLGLHAVGFYIIYEAVNETAISHDTPYIFTGQLIQDYFPVIVSFIAMDFLLFWLSILLTITPKIILDKGIIRETWENKEREGIHIERPMDNPRPARRFFFTAGIGGSEYFISKRTQQLMKSGKTRTIFIRQVGITLALSSLITAAILWIVQIRGIMPFLYIVYILTIIILAAFVGLGLNIPERLKNATSIIYSPSKEGQEIEIEPAGIDKFITQRELGSYLTITIFIVAIVSVGLIYLSDIDFIFFGILFLSSFFLLSLGALFSDISLRPKLRSDNTGKEIYALRIKSTLRFGAFAVYGGFLLVLAGMLYTFDIDRYGELFAHAKLFLFIGILFPIVLKYLSKIPARIWFIVATLSLLGSAYFVVKTTEEAATTEWYKDINMILAGFPFMQSWQHSFLTAVPIAIVLAVHFNHYREYHMRTQHHGIHLEAQTLFLITMLILGLSIGHDKYQSGPSWSKFQENSQKLYEFFINIFIVVAIITALTILISMLKFLKEIGEKRKGAESTITLEDGKRVNTEKTIDSVDTDEKSITEKHKGGMD